MKSVKSIAALCALVALLGAGCSKKEAEATGAPAEPTAKADKADKNAPAAPAQPENAAVKANLTEVDEAVKKREYDKAAAVLLETGEVASELMSQKQNEAYQNKMREFQSNLGAAAAAGDPKAIQAMQMLRARSRGPGR